MKKQIWMLVGGNGSGKSSFYGAALASKGIAFVNADLVAKTISDEDTPERAKLAQEQSLKAVYEKIGNGETFCYETVFSHESKVELVRHAKKQGYDVILVVVGLRSPELNVARVIQRVRSGGHQVPHDKIIPRVIRMFANVKSVLKEVDEAILIDNSTTPPLSNISAHIKNGKIISRGNVLNPWAEDLLSVL